MKVVVPYANDVSDPCVHHCVKLNLALLQIDAEWVRMREPNDYALLVNRLWAEGDPFVLYEHDVIAWRGAVEDVWECPEPFCGYDGMLQVAKVTPVGECPVDPATSWFRIDGELHLGMQARGVVFHDHCVVSEPRRPPVVNLNRENVPKSGTVVFARL